MDIKTELKTFYNKEAQKYTNTRHKNRAEADLILKEIANIEKKNIKILELGCGWGRFLDHICKLKNNRINYTWVDLSENLIKIIENEFNKKNIKNIKAEFICDDMTNYISKAKQESFDLIVCIASFQHIPSYKERLFLVKNFYRILNYWWKVIMTNRSFSLRFIKKYYKNIIDWFVKNLFRHWKFNIKDIEIPWKSRWTIYKRYYHIFTINELSNISKLSGFIIKKLCYITNKWQESNKIKEANNSIIIMNKDI